VGGYALDDGCLTPVPKHGLLERQQIEFSVRGQILKHNETLPNERGTRASGAIVSAARLAVASEATTPKGIS